MRRRPRTCPRSYAQAQQPITDGPVPQFFKAPELPVIGEVRVTPQAPAPSSVSQSLLELAPGSPLEQPASPPPPPQAQQKPKGPFSFLRDGTRSLRGVSPFLGGGGQTSIFPPQKAAGGLLGPRQPSEQEPDGATNATPRAEQDREARSKTHSFPSWSTWKNWKKISLDLYIRLLDRPRDTRVRLKQTIALLPVVKLKPVIDVGYRGPGKPPVAMHLDVKLLDCIKYRVRADGSSSLQVRAKAPLSDPRFVMDVVYERDLATALDSVKISFRALEVAFLKAPGFGAGIKFPIRFDNGIKSTIRVKKYLVAEEQSQNPRGGSRRVLLTKGNRVPAPRKGVFGAPSGQPRTVRRKPMFGISGPSGVDVKLRCLEYR